MANRELWEPLIELVTGRDDVSFQWVKGHSGDLWNDRADALQPHPFAKKLLSRLPGFLWPKPQRYGLVVRFDERGQAVESLHDPTGERVFEVTTAREHEGILYLGNLHQDWLARYTLRRSFLPMRVGERP